jgi:hypothetical protein
MIQLQLDGQTFQVLNLDPHIQQPNADRRGRRRMNVPTLIALIARSCRVDVESPNGRKGDRFEVILSAYVSFVDEVAGVSIPAESLCKELARYHFGRCHRVWS